MPELPEVEAVRTGLEQLVLGKEIQEVQVFWPKIIVTDLSLDEWSTRLVGQVIQSMRRRAKYLLMGLTDGELVIHLRMEGKFNYFPAEALPETRGKHAHVVFAFRDGSQLHYDDVRKFGRMEWLNYDQEVDYFTERKLGPEPVASQFQLARFAAQLSRLNRAIKPVLLDQKLVVGLGNIYVDETLFRAKIHPATPANQLTADEVACLHDKIIEVLAEAVEAGGSTIRTYRNSLGEAGKFQTALAVYGRAGEPCPVCGEPISKIKLAQRGTHFCAHCQPMKKGRGQ